MNIDKNGYLMKLFNKSEAKKKSFDSVFDKVQKIQDGRHENPRWRLISGISFMSISSIDFKKWRGDGQKMPSLNRVNPWTTKLLTVTN